MTLLLGVAHGSKHPASQEVVGSLLAQAAALRPGLRTAAAFVDNASPSVRSALAALDGPAVVLPLLLTPASHSKTDVAAAVQEARLAGKQLRYGRPLGPHPALVHVLVRRLAEAGAWPTDPVVLVAGGALDPDANAQVAATARLLLESGEWPVVDVAFASTARPDVPTALERLRAQGFSRVAVARYFLGPGRLPGLVERQARAVAGIDLVLTEPLGAASELARLLLERYDEALRGDLRMNCDVCLYRTPMPGLEHLVGTPQQPHDHPDDRHP